MSSDKMPSSENLISEPLSVIDSLFGKCAMRVLTQTCQRWNCQEGHAPSPFITRRFPYPSHRLIPSLHALSLTHPFPFLMPEEESLG